MSYIRSDAWKEDSQIKEDLQKYTGQLFKREEILSFVMRDYSCCTWCVHSLDRRLRRFGIFLSDKDVSLRKQSSFFAPGPSGRRRTFSRKVIWAGSKEGWLFSQATRT